MATHTTRKNALALFTGALTLLALSIAVAPATAASAAPSASASTGQSCWTIVDTGESGCYPTGLDTVTQIEQATGTVVVAEPSGTGSATSSARSNSTNGVAATYVTASLWAGPNQTGDTATYLTTSSALCNGFVYGYPDLGSFNDRAQSFQGYNGCRVTLYKDINYMGLHIGPASSAPNLGAFNNAASSMVASA